MAISPGRRWATRSFVRRPLRARPLTTRLSGGGPPSAGATVRVSVVAASPARSVACVPLPRGVTAIRRGYRERAPGAGERPQLRGAPQLARVASRRCVVLAGAKHADQLGHHLT